MSEDFVLNAESRSLQGKGASRRLRREGKVPAIIYGGKSEPQALAFNRLDLEHHLENEAFYSHILTINVDGKDEDAVVKDLQRHPAKGFPMHMDLQRIVKGQKIRMNVPLHFMGEEEAPGVKLEGGVFQHLMIDVEVEVLPRNLPEYIEVDVSEMKLDDAIHLSELVLPEGVELVTFLTGGEDTTVVSVHMPRIIEEEDEDTEESAEVEAIEQGGDDEGEAEEDKGENED